jgi:restriction system protein
MPAAWMIRAGEGGHVVEDFAKGFAAIGWDDITDLSQASTREAIRALYTQAYPDSNPGKAANAVGVIFKFRTTLKRGDRVVTYDPAKREYLVGTVDGDYFYDPKRIAGYPHLRKVKWEGRVSRDHLPVSSRNSLGSTLTMFAVDDEVWSSIEAALHGKPVAADVPGKDEKAELEETREEASAKAHELIKDQVLRLDDSDLEFSPPLYCAAWATAPESLPKAQIAALTSLRRRTAWGSRSRVSRPRSSTGRGRRWAPKTLGASSAGSAMANVAST